MTDVLTIPLDELKARRDSARIHAERPDAFPFAKEDYEALDALIRVREQIPASVLQAAVHGGDGGEC